MTDKTHKPINPAKRLTIFVLFCLFLILLILAFIWIKWEPREEEPVVSPPIAPVETEALEPLEGYGGFYYYAGKPKAISYPNRLQVLTNIGYVVAYDNERKNPAWVCYRLFRMDNIKSPPRPKGFRIDRRTIAKVSSGDYTGSTYDRGHCAPNRGIAICYGIEAQLETFYMSNILPQKPALNQQVWESLESMEIIEYAQRYGMVWVITGPVYGATINRLNSGVEIPQACFKIIAREDKGAVKVVAFIIPQDVKGSEKPSEFLYRVDDIETETGLDFMSELPDDLESRVEAEKAGLW